MKFLFNQGVCDCYRLSFLHTLKTWTASFEKLYYFSALTCLFQSKRSLFHYYSPLVRFVYSIVPLVANGAG